MKLKLDENGKAEVIDGKPVYVHDDGKEVPFDAPGTMQKISTLNNEAKSNRLRLEAAEEKLKTFEGIDNPEVARKALSTVANLDQKKLIDAGEVERVKADISKGFESKLETERKEKEALQKQLFDEKVGGSFARSKFISDKVAIPSDLVQSRFGNHFAVENGRIVGSDSHGNKIYSRSNPAEYADFEEALEILVDQYPSKNSILKPSGNVGGGDPNTTTRSDGAKTMTEAEFNKLGPKDRAAKMAEGYSLI